MKNFQVFEMTPQEFMELLDRALQGQIAHLKKELKAEEEKDDLLTREQAAEFLQVNEVTLWRWTSKGKITAYSLAGKRYYKRKELLDAMVALKR